MVFVVGGLAPLKYFVADLGGDWSILFPMISKVSFSALPIKMGAPL